MTELRKAVLAYISKRLGYSKSSQSKRYRQWDAEYRDYLNFNGIDVKHDGRNWYVYQYGNLIEEAPRRWLVTKTNPKPRELMPRFKRI